MGGGHGRRRREQMDENKPGSALPPPPKLTISDRRMLQWFASNLGSRWLTILIAFLAMIISAGADMVQPLLVKDLVDDVFVGKDMSRLMPLIWMLVGVFFASSLFNAIRMNLMHRLGQVFVYEMRIDTYSHLQSLSLGFFERNKTGDVMSRLSNDVNAVEDMVVHGTDEVISNVLRVGITIGIIFWLNWQLALLALSPLPIFLVCIIIFARFVRPIYRRIREDLGEINAQLEERLQGVRVIKAFAREHFEFGNFQKASEAYLKANVRAIWLWSTFFPALNFLVSMSLVLVMWRGGVMMGAGSQEVTTGMMMAYIGYLQQFYWRFGSLIRVYDMYNRALASLARIFQLRDEMPEVEDAPDAEELAKVQGDVELDHVSFRYATGDMVLKDVSVHARPGETVALVGRSGAGKTSLINLIPRFYDTTEGTVRVDGRDVRTVTQESLRSHIAMVLQETFLFNASVSENVRYGRLDASDEEVTEACKAAYADDFIMDLPEKYDTEIGERGVKLSGGQRQRLSIARALLADPRILILDEATSLIDTEAEQIIQKALDNLMRERTTFVIAHRLSTIRNADKIVVIDSGAIVEAADHKTLMERNGLYAEMYERQFRIAEEWGLGGATGIMPGGPPR